MLNDKLVSVIMPSYNHAAFIKEAVNSVLGQTHTHLELIITDDGSSDNSVEIIRTINDPRIKLFVFEKNLGAGAATNNCIKNARGEYIALINSDDMWHADKLSSQLEVFKSKPALGAVFTAVEFVKENGQKFSEAEKPYFSDIFLQKNRTQGEWVKRMFFEGNCLCHPSILMKKSCYDELGMYDERFRQLPDFEMWTRVVKKYDIHVLDKKLVYFRMLTAGTNVSAPNPANSIRDMNERYLIAQHFFDDIAEQDFREWFADKLTRSDFSGEEELKIEKALIYFSSTHWEVLDKVYQLIGMQKLFALFSDPVTSEILNQKYGYDLKSLQKMLSQIQLFINPGKENELANHSARSMIKEVLMRARKRGVKRSFQYVKKMLMLRSAAS